MRAKPSSNTRSSKANRTNGKSHSGNLKGIIKKSKNEKNKIPDLSVLRQPVDTSISGLKQAVKVFETGTPEVLHLLTYDCDVVYECKVCRNLFRSLANFISHKRIYCTVRYSRSQDLQRSNKDEEDCTLILGEKSTEKLPTRITARKDLTSIVEALSTQKPVDETLTRHDTEKKNTTVHLEPMDNTSYGVFQTVLKPDNQNLMSNQVAELQNLLSQNEVVLGPDGRILQNGFSDLHQEDKEIEVNEDSELVCSICKIKFSTRKTLTKHKRIMHESVRTCYSCPCCKNFFANPWSVYRHLYKVHRKTNEQVRRLRNQIHKKEIRVDKPVVNSVGNKKIVSPGKKKPETEQLQVHRANKEWMEHLEDDWELQRCGGCGRKFERKAALISHSQICQKRIAAFNRIQQNHQVPISNNSLPVVALSSLPSSKKPVPKPSPEKKIGIQVRMNYCKNSSPSHTVSRIQSCSRSGLGDESDLEAVSIDGKDQFFHPDQLKTSLNLKESSVLEQFFQNANKCRTSEGIEKVSSFLTNTTTGIGKVHTYEISTCKRSTILRNNLGKNKNLEAKCLQLRSALENGTTQNLKNDKKEGKEDESKVYFDSSIDNTSESNTSAVSSLSSQLTPLVEKGFVCQVEQSIEIKNINISRTVEKVPSTEADSTSMMSNGGNLHMTFNSRTFTGNIKISPNKDQNCEEVTTSLQSDETHQIDSNLHIDSSCLNDDEISVDLKPICLEHDSQNLIQERELENTISILTRNQLKAICKDDLVPVNEEARPSDFKKKESDIKVDIATKEMTKKKLFKYLDQNKNICSICNKKFKRIQDSYRHLPTHTLWKRYECLFNGCKFQTFWKKMCLEHVIHIHNKKDNKSGDSPASLVGIIDQSKWNFRLQKPNKFVISKPITKVTKVSSYARCRETKAQKLMKPVSKHSNKKTKPIGKNKLSVKQFVKQGVKQIEVKKNQKTKVITKDSHKQKLLTDFKTFKEMVNLRKKSNSQSKKINTEHSKSPKRKSINSNFPNKTKSSVPIENGICAGSNAVPGKSVVKKRDHFMNTNNSQLKTKLAMVKKEIKEDEMIVNHIIVDNTDSTSIKGKGSRTSSRKSSSNSVDQQKVKNLNNSVIKVEDNLSLHFTPTSYDLQSSINIQNPEIIEGSSLEEEESQESDKPVDDSHLKKIFMEVIFGPPSDTSVQPAGRPVRNKTRPKRDSDFILGNHTEVADVKINKKAAKLSPDSKQSPEVSRKPK